MSNSIFKNPFFSVKGQVERLTNAAKTVVAAVLPKSIGGGVVSTLEPKSKVGQVANKVLETAANHPFATAAVATVAAKPKVAVEAAKEVGTAIKNTVSKVASKVKPVVGNPIVQATGASITASKLSGSSQPQTVVMPGQPAIVMPTASTPTIISGQPSNGGVYSLPSTSATGQAEGSSLLPTGDGLTNAVVQTVMSKPEQVEEMPAGNWAEGNTTGQPMIPGGGDNPFTGPLKLPSGPVAKRSTTPSFTSKRSTKSKKHRSSKSRKHKSSKSRKHGSSRKHYGTERQYKRKGGKSVHYTKNGQPYIILNSGKARFIKKSSRRR